MIGNVVDVVKRQIYLAEVLVKEGKIEKVTYLGEENNTYPYFSPGLVDAHIHIESTMISPYEFARVAVKHGTVAAICDPHEIANVLGKRGIDYMIKNGKCSPFKFYFGAPSCVPATNFETSGAVLNSSDIETLLQRDDIYFLAEMMNYPGVILGDEEVTKKLALSRKYGKPIDGHAPLLSGEELKKYVAQGITTDHECNSLREAEEKIRLGMNIQIRGGSAASNFDKLIPLMEKYPQKLSFCSDDKHPDDLVEGHINLMVKRAISMGYNALDVITAATLNPINHYKISVGLLQKGDAADFIVVDNLFDFNIKKTFIDGNCVAQNGRSLIPYKVFKRLPNKMISRKFVASDFEINTHLPYDKEIEVPIIGVIDGELITESLSQRMFSKKGKLEVCIDQDILKIAVINRYKKRPIALGFVKNFGLKKGAIASSIAHDSHNVVMIGCSDEEMAKLANQIFKNGGIGICVEGKVQMLPLPIAGLMSNRNIKQVGRMYRRLLAIAKTSGCGLSSPFMSMSFMSLLVIPSLRLSDKGLFDVNSFSYKNINFE